MVGRKDFYLFDKTKPVRSEMDVKNGVKNTISFLEPFSALQNRSKKTPITFYAQIELFEKNVLGVYISTFC